MNFLRPVPTQPAFVKFSLLCAFLLAAHLAAGQQNTLVKITGFKHERGKALIRVSDVRGKIVETFERSIVNRQVVIQLSSLTENRYAIEVFHDENSNQKLDTATLGYPVEPWGVSNNVRPKLRAPVLEEMLIPINKEILILVK